MIVNNYVIDKSEIIKIRQFWKMCLLSGGAHCGDLLSEGPTILI